MASGIFCKYNLDISPDSLWITITPGSWARQSLVYAQEAGDFHARAGYYTERTGLDSFLIKYVVSGEGFLEYEGQKYTLGPGSLFWIDCNLPQRYGTNPDKGDWRILWVHFSGGASQAYYEQFLRGNGMCPVRNMGIDSPAAQVLTGLISLYRDGQSGVAADVQASSLLTSLMAQCITSHLPEKEEEPLSIRQARIYLNQHYQEHITLQQLGQLFSIDKFYFQKLFKRHVGLSPNEYLLLVRITKAKQFLRETSLSVGQIAGQVGIGSASHFIRLFRQQEHITPNAYRRNWNARTPKE